MKTELFKYSKPTAVNLCFSQVMPDSQIQAIQNLGTALITMGAGSIVDEYGKFAKTHNH